MNVHEALCRGAAVMVSAAAGIVERFDDELRGRVAAGRSHRRRAGGAPARLVRGRRRLARAGGHGCRHASSPILGRHGGRNRRARGAWSERRRSRSGCRPYDPDAAFSRRLHHRLRPHGRRHGGGPLADAVPARTPGKQRLRTLAGRHADHCLPAADGSRDRRAAAARDGLRDGTDGAHGRARASGARRADDDAGVRAGASRARGGRRSRVVAPAVVAAAARTADGGARVVRRDVSTADVPGDARRPSGPDVRRTRAVWRVGARDRRDDRARGPRLRPAGIGGRLVRDAARCRHRVCDARACEVSRGDAAPVVVRAAPDPQKATSRDRSGLPSARPRRCC